MSANRVAVLKTRTPCVLLTTSQSANRTRFATHMATFGDMKTIHILPVHLTTKSCCELLLVCALPMESPILWAPKLLPQRDITLQITWPPHGPIYIIRLTTISVTSSFYICWTYGDNDCWASCCSWYSTHLSIYLELPQAVQGLHIGEILGYNDDDERDGWRRY